MPGSSNITESWPRGCAGSRPAANAGRLRVPQGIGRMNMLHLNVAADGTCEMSEEDAESFLRAGWDRADLGDQRG